MNLEKTKLNKSLVLMCVEPMMAHWGHILIVGQEYTGEIVYVNTEIITDYDNYWHYTGLIADSFRWLRKGYDETNLHEVMPGYKTNKEVHDLYTKRIDMPFVRVKCSDGQTNSFCLLSDSELFSLGSDIGKGGRSEGKPCFSYSVNKVDDYFDYASMRRDNVLNKILNGSSEGI
jgi:hypothetical protein